MDVLCTSYGNGVKEWETGNVVTVCNVVIYWAVWPLIIIDNHDDEGNYTQSLWSSSFTFRVGVLHLHVSWPHWNAQIILSYPTKKSSLGSWISMLRSPYVNHEGLQKCRPSTVICSTFSMFSAQSQSRYAVQGRYLCPISHVSHADVPYTILHMIRVQKYRCNHCLHALGEISKESQNKLFPHFYHVY